MGRRREAVAPMGARGSRGRRRLRRWILLLASVCVVAAACSPATSDSTGDPAKADDGPALAQEEGESQGDGHSDPIGSEEQDAAPTSGEDDPATTESERPIETEEDTTPDSVELSPGEAASDTLTALTALIDALERDDPAQDLALRSLASDAMSRLVPSLPTAPIADTTVGAAIDWEMPPRYWQSWTEYVQSEEWSYPSSFVNPSSWTLTLDGCASRGPSSLESYAWEVRRGGTEIATSTGSDCRTTVSVPTEGDYDVTLTVSSGSWSDTASRVVTVEDLLIVSIGDSSAAGEGNPMDPEGIIQIGGVDDTTQGFDPGMFDPDASNEWISDKCHRSPISGHAMAAQQLEEASKHSSVTFLSFACSGAKVGRGLLEPYSGIESDETDGKGGPDPAILEPQLDQVLRAVCGRRLSDSLDGCREAPHRTVDQMLVSIGVNDAHFSKVLIGCATPIHDWSWWDLYPPQLVVTLVSLLDGQGERECHEAPPLAAPTEWAVADRTEIETYNPHTIEHDCATADCVGESPSSRLGEINRRIENLGLDIDETYLVGYPAEIFPADGGCGAFTLVTSREAEWINGLGWELQEKMIDEAVRNGWFPVVGIGDRFAPAERRGYCAGSERMFVTFIESVWDQGDKEGSVHPNYAGHVAIAEQILGAIDRYERDEPVPEWDVSVTVEAMRIVDQTGTYDPENGVGLVRAVRAELLPYATREARQRPQLNRSVVAVSESEAIRPGEWFRPEGLALRTAMAEEDDHLRFDLSVQLPRIPLDGVAKRIPQQDEFVIDGIDWSPWLSIYAPPDPARPGGDGTIGRPVSFQIDFRNPESRLISTRIIDDLRTAYIDLRVCVVFEPPSLGLAVRPPATCTGATVDP